MQQATDLYTIPEYIVFLEEYLRLASQIGKLGTKQANQMLDLERRLSAMREIYRTRLPIYLLAICPICDKHVTERVDTFSLNGPGWQLQRYQGMGWYGPLPVTPAESEEYRRYPLTLARPSFETECPHIQCMDWCVNLNHEKPTEVMYFSELSEVPHLLVRLMSLAGMYVVIHSLAIRRVDASATRSFTAYCLSYFSSDEYALQKAIDALGINDYDNYLLIRPPWDFDLIKWVQSSRLLWLDTDDPELPLKRDSVESFPYGHIHGHKNGLEIKHGKIAGLLSFLSKIFQ